MVIHTFNPGIQKAGKFLCEHCLVYTEIFRTAIVWPCLKKIKWTINLYDWKIPTDCFFRLWVTGALLFEHKIFWSFPFRARKQKTILSPWLVPSHFLESPVISVATQCWPEGGEMLSILTWLLWPLSFSPSYKQVWLLLSLLIISKVWSLPERCHPSKPSSSILMKTRTAMSRWGAVSSILSSQRDFSSIKILCFFIAWW